VGLVCAGLLGLATLLAAVRPLRTPPSAAVGDGASLLQGYTRSLQRPPASAASGYGWRGAGAPQGDVEEAEAQAGRGSAKLHAVGVWPRASLDAAELDVGKSGRVAEASVREPLVTAEADTEWLDGKEPSAPLRPILMRPGSARLSSGGGVASGGEPQGGSSQAGEPGERPPLLSISSSRRVRFADEVPAAAAQRESAAAVAGAR
jgi:hypothetical protein